MRLNVGRVLVLNNPPARVTAVPPHASASFLARSKSRLAMMTCAPLNLAPKARPRPAPPAPTTTTVESGHTNHARHVMG